MWTYDNDSGGRWMVFDDSLPDDAPVVCREIRSEAHARMIAFTPELHAYVAAAAANGDKGAKLLINRLAIDE